jgi:dienelactone hydrolase
VGGDAVKLDAWWSVIRDERHSIDEQRFVLVGESCGGGCSW